MSGHKFMKSDGILGLGVEYDESTSDSLTYDNSKE